MMHRFHPERDSRPDSADHWLAYRYLAGELTDGEAAVCEARLEHDLSLQAALAECVLLNEQLTALRRSRSGNAAGSGTTRRSRPRSDSRSRSRAWATAAVGLLAVGLLWSAASVTPRQILTGDPADVAVLNPASVVAMWSELDVAKVFPPDARETAMKLDALDEEPDLEIPDWLLAAVLAETAEGEDAGTRQEHQL